MITDQLTRSSSSMITFQGFLMFSLSYKLDVEIHIINHYYQLFYKVCSGDMLNSGKELRVEIFKYGLENL